MPFVGMVLSLTNSVRIRRGSARAGLQFISRAEEEMEKGSSVLLFPEGTRSRSGSMRPFRDGAFVLAKRRGSGIIPIVHTGTEKTFDSGSWVLKGRADIFIRVLDEITPEEVKHMELKKLMQHVRQLMEKGLAQLESEKSDKY